jgi:hypothetical protein
VKYTVVVTQVVEVTLNKRKFSPKFLREFREEMYPFETVERHAEHLAQLHARGLYDLESGTEFVEGYGPASDMGISARVVHWEQEVEQEP